jgi:Holliday junction resolvase-like predicted endonuclease
MDINKQHTPIDEPVAQINSAVISEISNLVKARLQQDVPTDEQTKTILNLAYEMAIAKLHKLLDSRHPASWILEAYKQTFMWTAVYKQELTPWENFESPKELAPIGRFGWRYAIEYLLSKKNLNSISRVKPTYDEVSEAFTLLNISANSAEWSNLIHFFPDVYGNIKFDLTTDYGLLTPLLDNSAEPTLAIRSRYMFKKEVNEWSRLTTTRAQSIERFVESTLSTAMKEELGFTIAQLKTLIDALCRTILSSGYTIILPGRYMIDWASDESGIPKDTVANIFDFINLSPNSLTDIDRDFLDKKDPIRMINFAGVRIDNLNHLGSIYPKPATKKPHIKQAKWHIIINIFMLGEWYDTFMYKCSNGQRQDLKSYPVLNHALEKIEQFQRRDVFESVVAEIFTARQVKRIQSLKKWRTPEGRSIPLPCGEIDIIAYHEPSGVLFVVECKAGAPALDSRGFSQQQKDHFKQKKYDEKFRSKIEWVTENIPTIFRSKEFDGLLYNLDSIKVVPVFVTRYPTIIKFYIEDYKVMTFAELDEYIVSTITDSAEPKT